MKKTLLLFVTLLSVTLTNAQLAAGATFDDGSFNYTVTTATDVGSPNTVSLTGPATGFTVPAALVIPDSVLEDGTNYAITLIANQAFKDAAITSLVVDGETVIGNQSFWGSSVESVSAPLSTSILNQAFRECGSLTSVSIPNVTALGVQTFRACAFTTIDLPSVTTIGPALMQGLTFWQCSNLQTISIPVVETITVGAFNSCTALESITFPATLTTLDETNFNMFKGCTSLTNVTVEYTTFIPLTEDIGAANPNIFADVTLSGVTLTIPAAATATDYSTGAVWKDFGSLVVAPVLSVDSNEQALGWSFYPNPAKDVVSIENNSQLQNAAITVYDLNGRAVLSQNVNSVQSEINISNLHSGIYLFNVTTDAGAFVKRIVKQ